MSYEDWQKLNAPSWLQGTNGGGFEAEFGSAKDDILDRARLGVLARFPGSVTRETDQAPALAPADALEHTGADRGLPRAPAEPDSTYSARLLSAWDDYAYLGGPLGMLRALAVMGYSSANIIQDNGRYWYLSAGTLTEGTLMTMATRGRAGWQFDCLGGHDVRGDLWSRFALLFAADAANLSGQAGQAILNGIVHRWRPGFATFMGTYVVLAGAVWGWPTTETWSGAGNWGGDSVRIIPPDGNAAYVDGP
jgi:hypothetical protein